MGSLSPKSSSKQHVESILAYWKDQMSRFGVGNEAMMLNQDAHSIHPEEQGQITAILSRSFATMLEVERDMSWHPSAASAAFKVLELAGGSGRFTGWLASHPAVGHVTTVDFMREFVEQNRLKNGHLENVTFICSDALLFMDECDDDSYDFVFINWLFMYLDDVQCQKLMTSISRVLKPGARIFLRESCVRPSKMTSPNPLVHYRDPSVYVEWLDERKLVVKQSGNIKAYEQHYGNPNQNYWECESPLPN